MQAIFATLQGEKVICNQSRVFSILAHIKPIFGHEHELIASSFSYILPPGIAQGFTSAVQRFIYSKKGAPSTLPYQHSFLPELKLHMDSKEEIWMEGFGFRREGGRSESLIAV